MRRIVVDVPGAPYEVRIGTGVLAEAGNALAGRRRAAVVTQAAVAAPWGPPLLAALADAGIEHMVAEMADGEDAKALTTVEDLCRRFAAWGLRRDDAVVALGGGVVGDTAGFAAGVYQRGIAVLQVPTTLLAQVDAAVGGKTAVNLPEGKNLVGAFHQPVAVLADVATLATLPDRDFSEGLGEVAKYALMPGGERVAVLVTEQAASVAARDAVVLEDLVAECVALKAAVVALDPEERTGARAALNYGHTLAHALETVAAYDLRHGEAVAIGLVFDGALAGALGRIDAASADRHRSVVEALGLPSRVTGGFGAGALIDVMQRDKKSTGGLSFVLPGDRGLEVVHDPPAAAVAAAFLAVGVSGDVGG